MTRIFLLIIFCGFSLSIHAQQQPWNGFSYINDWQGQQDNKFAQGFQSHIQNVGQFAKNNTSNFAAPILTIPVVIHIIHESTDLVGENSNLTIAQVQSQIDRLNEAFRNNHPNLNNIPSVFQNAATDAEIEFCLANIDPNGQPTNGINRYVYPSFNTTTYIENNIKPTTQWNPANYLNIWVVPIPGTNILGGIQGYAYAPIAGFAGVAPTDGVVVDYRFFGVGHQAVGEGITTVREVGHYLGLLDTWGLNNANGTPIGCTSDDGLNDTPDQAAPTGMNYSTCPTTIPQSCGTNDMYTNFMDYSKDQSCQTMFTAEQVNVMRSVLIGLGATVGLGNRNTLITSSLTVCNIPCSITTSTSFTPESCGNLMNGTATVNASGGTAPYTYAWNTSPVQTTNSITGLAAGTYQVTVTDATGCQSIETIEIATASNITATVTTNDVSCVGNDGSATVTPIGGTAPYTTTWLTSTPQIGNTLSNISTGIYPYSIIDAVGCTYSDFTMITNNCDSICDTVLYAPNILLVSPNLYFNPYNSGFISGTSSYNDLAMANYTNYQGIHSHIISVILGVGYVNGSPNSQLELVVWDEQGGKPNNEIGSQLVRFQDLITNVGQDFQVDFSEYIPINSSFFIGFKMPNAASGDTIAFATNTIGDGADSSNIAWTQHSDGTWHSYLEDWNEDFGLAILPVLGTPPVADFLPTNVTTCNGNAQVSFTNQTTGTTTIEWILPGVDTLSPTALNPVVSYSTVGTYDAGVIAYKGCAIDTFLVPNAVTVNACDPSCTLYATLIQTNSICGNDGTATVTPMDGVAPYTILWSNNANINTISNLSVGTYTVTVTDANNCAVVGTVTITSEFSTFSTSTIGIGETCDEDDGIAIASASGGLAPYNFAWNNNSVSDTLTGLSAGNFTVTVTDANGCALSETVTINPLPVLVLDSLITNDISCNGNADGNALISISGGVLPYTYNWSNGDDSSFIDDLISGIYTVVVTDSVNCQWFDTVAISEPQPLVINILNVENVKCAGDSTGSISISSTGGTVPYSYSWSNGLTDSTLTNLPVGNYDVTVTDANNCTQTLSITINEPTPFILTVQNINHINCNGDTVGSASVLASGGVMPYSYIWSNNNLTNFISNVNAGTYTLTATDANNCAVTDTIIINQPQPIDISIQSITHISCAGSATGAATINVTGGTAPYNYFWSNNSMTNSISNVIAGLYIITITDANNCSDTLHVNINQNSSISLTSIDTTFISCNGGSNGGYIVTPTGGALPYSYSWSTNPAIDTFNAITGLSAGTYTVTITDAANCIFTQILILSEPSAISSNITTQNLNCATDQNGTAAITVTGGAVPYSYSWSHTSVNSSFVNNLGVGSYIVTITDANNCMHLDTAIITSPPPIVVTISTTPVSCTGGFDGTATANVTGGVGGYTYQWSNFQNGQTTNNLIAGQHFITVTDANSCQTIDTFTISTVPALTLVGLTSQSVSCNGLSDGTATIQVGGGTQPYSYTWNTTPVQTSQTASGLSAGTYTVSISDVNGCFLTPVMITIGEPSPLAITTLLAEDPLCNGGNDGLIQVSASGGTPTYFYNWSNGDTSHIQLDLTAGTYTVVVSDINGCNTSETITLNQPTPLTGTFGSTPTGCFGGNDGTIQVASATGGTPPYLYAINGVSFFPISTIQSNLFSGIYTVTLQDDNGCKYQQTVNVGEPSPLALDLGDDLEIILGQTVQLDATVPVAVVSPLTYTWTSLDTTMSCTDCAMPLVSPNNTVDYTVTVIDTNGCSATDEINIRVIKERRIFVPNLFSPNNDGNNDYLVVHGGTGVEEILRFRIFDRWGELVYAADNFAPNSFAHAWDGRFKGRELAPNVFVYYVEVRFSDGITHIYEGDVTLMR